MCIEVILIVSSCFAVCSSFVIENLLIVLRTLSLIFSVMPRRFISGVFCFVCSSSGSSLSDNGSVDDFSLTSSMLMLDGISGDFIGETVVNLRMSLDCLIKLFTGEDAGVDVVMFDAKVRVDS